MRLLVVTNLFPNARQPGRGVFNRQQVRELAKSSQLDVIAPVPWFPKLAALRGLHRWHEAAEVPLKEVIDGIDVYHPRYVVLPWVGRLLNGWTFALGIRRILRELVAQRKPDAILATWAYPDVVGTVLAARRLRVPLLAKVHGSDVNVAMHSRLKRRMVVWALRQCRKVLCVSDALRSQLAQYGLEPAALEMIRNGVDRTRFRPLDRSACRAALGLPPQRPMILFVGNLVSVKGVDRLVEAFARSSRKALLVIVGEGALRGALEQAIRAGRLEADVRLVGARPHEEIPQWIGASDAVCVPSRHEGCPNIVLEALACGRAVVAARIAGMDELVRDRRNGLLVAPGDVDALAASLDEVARITWDLQQLAAASPVDDWRHSAESVRRVIESVTSKAPLAVLHVLRISRPDLSGYAHRSHCVLAHQRRLGIRPVAITAPQYGEAEQTVGGIRYERSRPTARWLAQLPIVGAIIQMARFAREIERVGRREAVRLIHAHSPILCGLPAFWAARRLRLPFVYEVRALWEDAAVDQGRVRQGGVSYHAVRVLETMVLKRADRVVVICEGLRAELVRRGVAAERIIVVPNGVDPDTFVPAPRDERLAAHFSVNGGCVIGFIGSFFRFEGLETLVQSVPLILKGRPETTVLLIGGGQADAALRRLVEERGLSSVIRFAGRVPHEEIPACYAVMDVVVYPRLSERITELVTPLKPLEAMAMGKAVVASDVGGLRELVQDGRTGLLFRAGDAADLAAKCLAALEDRRLAESLGARAREYVARERDWRPICERAVAMYRELLK